jgi:DNA-binding transcriptional regulator YbjK
MARLPSVMRRQPNPEQRRLDLCDAAIELLAGDGAKGVSHLKIDRKAEVPDGTTSFYFRTRSALLQAVAERVCQLDLEQLQAATAGPSGLATLVIRSATGEGLVRTKARNELALLASRDPALEAARRRYDERFFSLIREAVVRLAESEADSELVDQQAYVVMIFISGMLLAFASGDRTIRTARQLDLIIAGIVAGVGSKS